MFKFNIETLVAYPVHTSLFVLDFLFLLFMPLIRLPIILNFLLVVGLVYLSMFYAARIPGKSAQ